MKDWDTGFSGSFFSNSEMLDELVVILFISLLLMYFILAAQFESFLQPLLVLAEIPIDLAFALLIALDLWTYAEFNVCYRTYCYLRYRNQ